MSVEAAALSVGKSVSRLVVSRWLAGHAARDAASKDLIELIRTGFPDEIKQRRVERQFAALADAVTERVLTYARQEFGDLTAEDREAIVHQAVLTLDRADLSDAALLADNMDAARLARRVHSLLPEAEAEFQLGEAGARLYRVVIDECCECLARILIQLPQFEPRAAAEALTRLSSMTTQMETVIARLPVRSLVAPEGESDDEEFGRRYMESVITALSQLEMFGPHFERFARPQTTLSVAYISLRATSEDSEPATPEVVPISDWRRHDRENGSVRVERALSERRLMLVRGEAGGGKSTLLSWLAVTAASGTFTGELADLNGNTPFLIELRHHADGSLPRPEAFIDDLAGNLSGLMPRAWVHRRLLSGQALLLVDGVDEVVETQRPAVRQWLRQIVGQFPEIRVVVTSRPAATEVGWLRSEGFGTTFLEQLGPADLRALVQHWHAAVRECADLPCAPEQLPVYEAKLLARLESAPHLRVLAGTPLLAAMLCALNLDRNTLPRDRMSLYAAALEMLLESRDEKRNVPSARTVQLEREQKIRLLEDLAWHLSTSDRVELPRATAERLITDRLISMPQIRTSAEAVLELLLQRSGVIREPVPGRIDFIHRTIQEYLSAKHAADLGDMDLLIHNAHADRWRETIVMAAGHANEPQRRELITGILERAQRESRIARQLKLLAVGCLETLSTVPEALRGSLEQCLEELVPPHDVNAARALATVGRPVLDRLPWSLEGLSESQVEATVQTVWLINGLEAMDVLARYAADRREVVRREVSRAWAYFDPDEYAERVLSTLPPGECLYIHHSPAQLAALDKVAPLGELHINLPNIEDMGGLEAHRDSLRSLFIHCTQAEVRPLELPDLPMLQELTVGVPGLASLQFLEKFPQLTILWLTRCHDIQDYSSLLNCNSLQTLVLFGSRGLNNLNQLPSLGSVRSLSLAGSSIGAGLISLADSAPNIRYLDLAGCVGLEDLESLAGLRLENLEINGCSAVNDLSPLNGQSRLASLDISRTQVDDLSPLGGLRELRTLQLTGCVEVRDLRPLARISSLRELFVERISPGVDLSPLAQNSQLTVHIARGQEVRGADDLGHRLQFS